MNKQNFDGPGVTPEARLRREMNAQRRALHPEEVSATAPWNGRTICPECGTERQNAETLRVHRWLAHDVKGGPS